MVLGSGFVLGMFRIPFLVPRLGERWAELAEMPIMAVVIYYSSGFILRRYPENNQISKSFWVGFLALALSVCAEQAKHLKLQAAALNVLVAPITFVRAHEAGNTVSMVVARRNMLHHKNDQNKFDAGLSKLKWPPRARQL